MLFHYGDGVLAEVVGDKQIATDVRTNVLTRWLTQSFTHASTQRMKYTLITDGCRQCRSYSWLMPIYARINDASTPLALQM